MYNIVMIWPTRKKDGSHLEMNIYKKSRQSEERNRSTNSSYTFDTLYETLLNRELERRLAFPFSDVSNILDPSPLEVPHPGGCYFQHSHISLVYKNTTSNTTQTYYVAAIEDWDHMPT